MNTLYEMLKKQKERNGLAEELKGEIDVLYLAGRLSEAEYKDLMDIEDEEEPTEVEETEEQ